MKRYNNIYEKIYSLDNLELAHKNARKGKRNYQEVIDFEIYQDYYLLEIQNMLKDNTYKTSDYEIFTINDRGKEREIYKLPYYPDRIVHWAIMLQIEDIFLKTFIFDSYAAIPNKGTHLASKRLSKWLKEDDINTKYCLKLDIKKYFPHINHEILKSMLRKKIKDKDLLWLLDEIIDSCDKGIPIGNYLSQYLANYYLTYLGHWLKEEKKIKYMMRYMDDIIILHNSKDFLHRLFVEIENYLHNNLDLLIKDNWQVFPVDTRGIDFVGYRHFRDYKLLRKSTSKKLKLKMRKLLKKNELNYSEWCSINSYNGHIKHCNSYNLNTKYLQPLEEKSNKFYREVIKYGKK